ncbi:hypothetical protein ABMZ87_10305 [Morganella morganii]|uniref:hypothetical protein n=1 Tax=Morganella morganii TaxID=582 RepID=UPI003EC0C593
MNERDWADWIAIGASVLSSLGIIVSVVIYLCQKSSENKKQKEIDKKIFYFANIKSDDLLNKITHITHLLENEDKYKGIEIKNGKIWYFDVEDEYEGNTTYHYIEIDIDNGNVFLDRNSMQASYELFKFILDIDSLNSLFLNKVSKYIEYIYMYKPDIPDDLTEYTDKDSLMHFLDETKNKINSSIKKLIT